MGTIEHDPERNPLRFLPAERHPLTLHPQDAAALDELVDGVPAHHRTASAQRRQRLEDWLKILGHAQVAQPPADLLAGTLAAVEKCRAREATEIKMETLRSSRFHFGRYVGEFATIAVAAALLLVVAVPGLGAARQRAKQTLCSASLGSMGQAFGNYAAAYHNALPTLGASADGSWLPHEGAAVVTGHSNTANLLPMVREGYVDKDKLVCPARGIMAAQFDPQRNEIPDGIRGYSYLNSMFGPSPGWDHQSTTIILADRNPLFARDGAGGPDENSLNHGRRGTNVLTAAGSVERVTTPDIGPAGDNIWTISSPPRAVYTGHERTESVSDLFLSP